MNAAAAVTADLAALDDPQELARFTRWAVGAGGQREGVSSLRLSGLHCAACAGLIEQALHGLQGVLEARVSAAAACAQVRWDPARTQASALIAAIRRAGYDAVPDAAAEARELRRAEARRALWRLFVAAFCSMQIMMLAAPSYLAAAGDLADDLRALLNWGSWVLALPVLVFSAAPMFSGAWRALRQRRIGMDVPVALGLAVTFVASTGATFDAGGVFGSEVYFDSLAMFVAFLLGARWLEMRARHRAAESLEDSLATLPETALRVAADGRIECVAVTRLRPGDRVRVPVGAGFAADGVLLEGSTQAGEAMLTGESSPVAKGVGDELIAGSVNLGLPVEMRVLRVGADTRHAAIVALVREASTQRPALARSVDRWAAPFLWSVLALAAAAGAGWWLIEPARAVWVVVAVLIVTCPCALSLAAPSAMLAAAGRLARSGVLLRRLDALDAMARVTTLFIDKTGTLTEDRPQWRAQVSLHDAPAADDAQWLARAGALAAWSSHPLSVALAAQARSSLAWHQVREWPGQGVEGCDVQGQLWRLGSAAFVGATGAADAADDGLHLWFGTEGQAWMRFDFDEALRADAAAAVARLHALGLRMHLLSGDRPERVQRLATQLQLDASEGGASPERKLAAVAQAQQRGEVVAMVGDGINDAPVLARADASFAMGQGALVARSSADAVVLAMRLSDVADALQLARRCRRVVRQNFVWAAAYNAACVPLALAGWLPPWAAGLGMAASSLVVVGNALRLTR